MREYFGIGKYDGGQRVWYAQWAAFVFGLIWQAERLARRRAYFVTTAAHQLKTPLASLRMHGDMLAAGLNDEKLVQSYARNIVYDTKRLGNLVSDMLGFSMLKNRRLSVRLKKGDLGFVVQQCVASSRSLLAVEGAEVVLAMEELLPQVMFDAEAVSHMLQNLLDNAEKYSRSSSNRIIEVGLKKRTGYLCLCVRDHGDGLHDKLSSLIKPFVRGEGADHPEGLGLGNLAIFCDANTNKTKYYYDAAGRLYKTNGADVGKYYRTYNYANLILMTNSAGDKVKTVYDKADRVVTNKFTDPVRGAVAYTYQYDGALYGKLDKSTDPTGQERYEYDTLGRLSHEIRYFNDFDESPEFSYTYDLTGKLLSKKYPTGWSLTNEYSYGYKTGISFSDGAHVDVALPRLRERDR